MVITGERLAALHLRISPMGTAFRRPAVGSQIPDSVGKEHCRFGYASLARKRKKKKTPPGLFSDRNQTVEASHLGGFAAPRGEKAFSGDARGEGAGSAPAALAEPRVSQRLLFPLTALVSAKSATEVGSSANSGKQRGDLLGDKPQSHGTLSTAPRGPRAPLSAANTSLCPSSGFVCFKEVS